MSMLKLIYCYIFINAVSAYYQSSSNVTVLTETNFYQLVDNGDIWVIHFYSSMADNSQSFAEDFALSADILKGLVKFGNIDVDDSPRLAKDLIVDTRALPIVEFFGISHDGSIKAYTGPKTAKDLVESVLKHIWERVKNQLHKKLPVKLVTKVTDNNFDQIITNSKEPWLVLFYAPWCVHCKELKPIWKLVASSLQKKIRCASIDATVNTAKASEYQIKEFPTVKLFPFEIKSPNRSFDYTQERTVESITEWALNKLPASNPVQITNREVFQKHCMDRRLCVITVLPPIYDCQAHCRREYLDILKQLAVIYKRQDWSWVWTEAGTQKELEMILDIGGSGYPALVVLNPAKMKYSTFKGAFSKNGIREFLTSLVKTTAVGVEGDLPEKIVTVKAWNGEDSANALPEELYLHDTEFSNKEEL